MSAINRATPGVRVAVIATGFVAPEESLMNTLSFPVELEGSLGLIFTNHLDSIDLTKEPRNLATLTFGPQGFALIKGLATIVEDIYTMKTRVDVLVRDALNQAILLKIDLSEFHWNAISRTGTVTGSFVSVTGEGVTAYSNEIFAQ